MEEWERHLSKMWDDQKDKIVTSLMKNLPRKNPINMMATSGARGNASKLYSVSWYAWFNWQNLVMLKLVPVNIYQPS